MIAAAPLPSLPLEVLPDALTAEQRARIAAVPLPRVPTRAQIEAVEDALAEAGMPLADYETRHTFWEKDGVPYYGREIVIPALQILTGKVHRFPHVNDMQEGLIVVWTEDGMKLLRAPYVFFSRAGTKRIGLTLERTRWKTIHVNPTGREDPAEMERILVEPARPALLAKLRERKLCRSH